MKYVEAPNYCDLEDDDKFSIFLAGGITDCPDWQQEMCGLLKDLDIVVLNPRRADFPMDDPSAAYKQINWEYGQLEECCGIAFWFPKGAIQPIALFELGRWSREHKDHPQLWKLWVGCDPEYERAQDVHIQMELEGIPVYSSLESMSFVIHNSLKAG